MTNNKSRIGIFVSSLQVGGAEKVATTLANEMATVGIGVDLIVMKSGGELQESLDSRVRVVDLNTNRGRFSFFTLIRYILENRPDAVLSLLTVPNVLLGLTRLVPMRNRPLLVGSEHSFDSDIYRRNDRRLILFCIYYLMARIGYRMLHVTIAVSEGVKERMLDRELVKEKKLEVISNPINLRNITPPTGKRPPLGSCIQLLAVGRLDRLKDYGTMIRAIKLVKEELDVELNVLGEGSERVGISSLIQQLELEHDVKLRGNVMDTSAWYQGADVFVLSSLREGFPNVIIEALAHGIPVVSTDCQSGPKEILLEPEHGALVPVGDYQQLAAAIISTARKETDRGLLRSRAEDFDSRLICSRYLRILLSKNTAS
jgi:glycosyltransferase involved in cell wall biosynthesis